MAFVSRRAAFNNPPRDPHALEIARGQPTHARHRRISAFPVAYCRHGNCIEIAPTKKRRQCAETAPLQSRRFSVKHAGHVIGGWCETQPARCRRRVMMALLLTGFIRDRHASQPVRDCLCGLSDRRAFDGRDGLRMLDGSVGPTGGDKFWTWASKVSRLGAEFCSRRGERNKDKGESR